MLHKFLMPIHLRHSFGQMLTNGVRNSLALLVSADHGAATLWPNDISNHIEL